MKTNCLKLNDSKTEFLVMSKQDHSTTLDKNSISIGEVDVEAVQSAKNIGVFIANTLSMEEQVNNVCRNCYISMPQISEIRPYLTQDATETLVKSLITSRLDCYNALLLRVPDDLLKKLQLAQNNAARLVTRSRPSHICPVLKKLHWLPVSFRIEYNHTS